MARQLLEGNRKLFQLKLIEILGKGFKDKEHHDFASDVEQSRAAYKIDKGEIEYFVMRALLSLPVIVTSKQFLTTVQKVLQFYLSTLLKLINAFVPKMECLRAIEDANFECDHLKIRESSAFLVHFLIEAGVLDGDTVLQFYSQLQERNSYLTTLMSFRMMITWVHDQAAKKREAQRTPTPTHDTEEEEDELPLSQWLVKGFDEKFHVRPLCICSMRTLGGNVNQKNRPLLVWVTKKEEVADDTDEQSDEEEIPDDDEQNENEDLNPEQNYGEEEQSDIEDDDSDENDELDDFAERFPYLI